MALFLTICTKTKEFLDNLQFTIANENEIVYNVSVKPRTIFINVYKIIGGN